MNHGNPWFWASISSSTFSRDALLVENDCMWKLGDLFAMQTQVPNESKEGHQTYFHLFLMSHLQKGKSQSNCILINIYPLIKNMIIWKQIFLGEMPVQSLMGSSNSLISHLISHIWPQINSSSLVPFPLTQSFLCLSSNLQTLHYLFKKMFSGSFLTCSNTEPSCFLKKVFQKYSLDAILWC